MQYTDRITDWKTGCRRLESRTALLYRGSAPLALILASGGMPPQAAEGQRRAVSDPFRPVPSGRPTDYLPSILRHGNPGGLSCHTLSMIRFVVRVTPTNSTCMPASSARYLSPRSVIAPV